MAAGTPLSAKNAKIRVGAPQTALYMAEWSVNPSTHFDDASNFEGAGFEQQVPCLARCTGRVSGFWDAGANPFDGPPQIQDGQRLTTVKFYVSGVGSAFWSFPLMDITDLTMDARAGGKLEMSFNWKAQGVFSYPTGNAA